MYECIDCGDVISIGVLCKTCARNSDADIYGELLEDDRDAWDY